MNSLFVLMVFANVQISGLVRGGGLQSITNQFYNDDLNRNRALNLCYGSKYLRCYKDRRLLLSRRWCWPRRGMYWFQVNESAGIVYTALLISCWSPHGPDSCWTGRTAELYCWQNRYKLASSPGPAQKNNFHYFSFHFLKNLRPL